MADWNSSQTWDDWTGRRQGRTQLPRFGEHITYLDGRLFANSLDYDGGNLTRYRRQIQQLGGIPNFTPATHVLIIGCGFGWLIEALTDLGANNVWGTDLSTLIQSLLTDVNVDVRVDIQTRVLNVDIASVTAKQQFKAAGAGDNKGEFNWIISEHVLEDMELASVYDLLADMGGLRNNQPGGVAHLVAAADAWSQEQKDSSLVVNQLTLAEWVALEPSHWWVDSHTGEIGGGQ